MDRADAMCNFSNVLKFTGQKLCTVYVFVTILSYVTKYFYMNISLFFLTDLSTHVCPAYMSVYDI